MKVLATIWFFLATITVFCFLIWVNVRFVGVKLFCGILIFMFITAWSIGRVFE